MAQKQLRTFETREEAVSFLYDNPEFTGDLRVRERDEDLTQDLSNVDNKESHSPDLPVTQGDVTHRCLWLLDFHNAESDERMLSARDILHLSQSEEGFDAGKALSSLLHAGYANKKKLGFTSYFYITGTGKRVLRDLDDPVEEIPGESVLEF